MLPKMESILEQIWKETRHFGKRQNVITNAGKVLSGRGGEIEMPDDNANSVVATMQPYAEA